jgi:hypothetical protein
LASGEPKADCNPSIEKFDIFVSPSDLIGNLFLFPSFLPEIAGAAEGGTAPQLGFPNSPLN